MLEMLSSRINPDSVEQYVNGTLFGFAHDPDEGGFHVRVLEGVTQTVYSNDWTQVGRVKAFRTVEGRRVFLGHEAVAERARRLVLARGLSDAGLVCVGGGNAHSLSDEDRKLVGGSYSALSAPNPGGHYSVGIWSKEHPFARALTQDQEI